MANTRNRLFAHNFASRNARCWNAKINSDPQSDALPKMFCGPWAEWTTMLASCSQCKLLLPRFPTQFFSTLWQIGHETWWHLFLGYHEQVDEASHKNKTSQKHELTETQQTTSAESNFAWNTFQTICCWQWIVACAPNGMPAIRRRGGRPGIGSQRSSKLEIMR